MYACLLLFRTHDACLLVSGVHVWAGHATNTQARAHNAGAAAITERNADVLTGSCKTCVHASHVHALTHAASADLHCMQVPPDEPGWSAMPAHPPPR